MSDRAKEIEGRLAGISGRPWMWERWKGILRVEADSGYEVCRKDRRTKPDGECAAEDEPNFTFLAHAPTDLAYLLGEVERLKGMLGGVAEMARDEKFSEFARLGAVLAIVHIALQEDE
jgi:hypothetical protein